MKILVAGDFCPSYRINDFLQKNNFKGLFANICLVTEQADYSIVNFEFPIVKNRNYARPITKCGPNLLGSESSVAAIRYAGFNCCTLANNHILDQGKQCCLDTIEVLCNSSIDTVGAGKNATEAERVLYKDLCGETLAIINCCEHEFSIADETSAGANPLNPIRQYYIIQEARKKADYIIVIILGGHEHFQLPTIRMQDTYRFFIDVGADAVVNHHQHCYSGYEVYKDKPVFYGLGNLLFDHASKRSGCWTEGYMVSIDFQKEKISFELTPYKQCTEDAVGVILMNTEEKEIFAHKIKELNVIIGDILALRNNLDKYYSESAKEELLMMEPYTDTIWYQFSKRGLLPKFLKGEKKLRIENHIICESHREKLIYALKKYDEKYTESYKNTHNITMEIR